MHIHQTVISKSKIFKEGADIHLKIINRNSFTRKCDKTKSEQLLIHAQSSSCNERVKDYQARKEVYVSVLVRYIIIVENLRR